MFDEIRGDLRNRPTVSVSFAVICTIITFAVLIEEKLKETYGVHDPYGVPFTTRLTAPFCHGYDNISTSVHFGITMIFFYFIGTYLEKIIGGIRFLAITLIGLSVYVLIHRLMLLVGNGFTPVIYTYSGVMLIVLFEGRFVKSNSVFDHYYKTLWIMQIILWIIAPIILTLVPIHFYGRLPLGERFLLGNIANFSCGFVGVILGVVFKGHIRKKLVQRTRKKYIKHSALDEKAWLFSILILGALVAKLIFR